MLRSFCNRSIRASLMGASGVTRLSSLAVGSTASQHNANKNLDPEKVVLELDKHIIGQYTAKRSVAIAFR